MLIRDVEIGGRPGLDLRIAGDRIAEIGAGLPGRADLDGGGGALMMGLVDHHIHLLATAARAASLRLDHALTLDDVAAQIREAAGGGWLRATGCPPALAEAIELPLLDRWAPSRPLRLQDQTGALWLLNSAALARLPAPLPPFVDRAAGRVWRGDAWLGAAIGREPPDLTPLGKRLARYGITAVTDASATNDAAAAALLAEAHRTGALPQRLTLMSAGTLPESDAYAIGPVKVLLDDRDLIPLDEFVARIQAARMQARAVAVHCVTAAELALTLAAFEIAGARRGDRIEHGGVIPAEAIAALRAMRLTVVTQPGFLDERGDRYRAEVDCREREDLYRCASLIAAGVPVAGSSDAPYAGPDCWRAMRTAMTRETASGAILGASERIDGRTALDLYRSAPDAPGRAARRIAVGAPADLCLLTHPLREAMRSPDAALVAATVIGGTVEYLARLDTMVSE